MVKDREAWRAAFHGITESDTTEPLNNTRRRASYLALVVKNLTANAGDMLLLLLLSHFSRVQLCATP